MESVSYLLTEKWIMKCCMYVQRILFYCKEKVNCIYVGVSIESSKLEKMMRSQNRDFRGEM